MKRQSLALLVTISMLAVYSHSSAQYNSAARVYAGGDRALCGTNCFDLKAGLTDIRSTDSYIVDSSLDYNGHYPFYIPGSGSVPAKNNVFSSAIDLPFTFCFYGKPYTQVAIGSNGIISFDPESMGKTCTPASRKEIPSRSYAYAAIMPAYEGLDLSLGGSIYYSTEGDAPNRKFIVNYNNIPLRSCSIQNVTFQVVLNETTNVVEIYLKDKPSCLYSYDGAGIAGIQKNHKEGLAIPGKNATSWGSAGMNAAYRFIPSGDAASQLVQLSNIDGKIISSVQATPSENGQLSASFGKICIEDAGATYIVSTTYSSCDVQNNCSDTINVTKKSDCGSENIAPAPVAEVQPSQIRKDVSSTAAERAPVVEERGLAVNHVSMSNPTTCLGINGSIRLHGLQPNTTYTISYRKNGEVQKTVKISTNAAGALIITRLSAGIYSNIKAELNGISSSEQGPYVLTDPELPATPQPLNPGTINPGEKISLAVSNPDRVSYTWLGPGFAAVNAAPVILNAQPYNAGTYTVVATRNGCNSKPATTTVAISNMGGIPDRTVPVRLHNNTKPYIAPANTNHTIAAIKHKAPPEKTTAAPKLIKKLPVSVMASSNRRVAQGGTIYLYATAKNAQSFAWSGPNNFTSNTQNPALNNVSQNAAGTYTVTAIGPRGNSMTATTTVEVEESTIIYIKDQQDASICYGYNGSITIAGVHNGKSYTVSYLKDEVAQKPRTLIADSHGDILIDHLGAGVYRNIQVVNGRNRSNAAGPVTIGSPQTPRTPLAANSGITEPGGTVVLSVTNIDGASYTWLGPNKFISHTQNPALYNVTSKAAGTYTVIANVGGCNAEPATTRVIIKKADGRSPVNIDMAVNNKPSLKPKKVPVTESKVDKVYKGIVISADNAHPGETIEVNYDDPIREPSKIVWNFGDATVLSGSGNGPYTLSWNKPGVKTVSLKLPFIIPGHGNILSKDILIYDAQVIEPTDTSRQPDLSQAIIARHEAEGDMVDNSSTTNSLTDNTPTPVPVATASGKTAHRKKKIHHEEIKAPVVPTTTENNVEGVNPEPAAQAVVAPPVATEPVAPQAAVTQPVAVITEVPKEQEASVPPQPVEQNIVTSRSNVCLNDTATVSLQSNVSDDAELDWNFGDATIVSGTGSGPFVVRWDEQGTKNIAVSIKDGNKKTELSSSINITAAPKADFILAQDACIGEKISVEINRDKDHSETHNWDFDGADVLSGDDGGPYEIKWEQPGKKVVSLIVRDASGCTSLPYREIINIHTDCCNISLPSAFTPNGDGKNDVFRAVATSPSTVIVRIVVRNRFGREIFSTNNPEEGWDGTYGSVPQEIGTYNYQVRYRCGETLSEKDGEVMLLR